MISTHTGYHLGRWKQEVTELSHTKDWSFIDQSGWIRKLGFQQIRLKTNTFNLERKNNVELMIYYLFEILFSFFWKVLVLCVHCHFFLNDHIGIGYTDWEWVLVDIVAQAVLSSNHVNFTWKCLRPLGLLTLIMIASKITYKIMHEYQVDGLLRGKWCWSWWSCVSEVGVGNRKTWLQLMCCILTLGSCP